jgi:hypothetical protein
MTENANATTEAPPADPLERTETLRMETVRPATFQRKRGAGFPIVALPEAVTILRKAGRHGNEHSISAFATYLGHSTYNSGSFKRRLAAFRDWKFILGATGDRVVFTDLGRRVAYPTDPTKEKRDLQEAFQNVSLFWKVYDDSAKGVAIGLATLANHGVQLGVAPASKVQFAESLVESAVEAEFAEMEGDKVVFISPGTDVSVELHDSGQATDELTVVGSTDQMVVAAHEASGQGRAGQARVDVTAPEAPAGSGIDFRGTSLVGGDAVGRDRYKGSSAEAKPAVLHQQSWDFEVGNLAFEIKSSRSLPSGAFMQIGRVMAEIEKLKEILAEGTESGDVGASE